MVTAMRGAGDKEGEGSKATAMATRMVGKGNKEGNGNGYRGGGQKEGNGNSSKSIGNGNKVGWRATPTRAMAMRVAGERW